MIYDMMHINLVSMKLKRGIKLRHVYATFKNISYVLIITTVFFATVILAAKIILQNNFNKIVMQTTLITKNSQVSNARVREINSRVDYINGLQNDFIAWSYLFEEISKNISNDIKFNSINIDKGKKEINLRGIAKTRDSLINFKEELDKSDMFYNIDFPIKNILEKENINFEIKSNLKIEKIKG